ncbi:hypothetical protein N7519_009198 [Penicillium mononematosum]|uniref:uncharacterized protein n=1 Tax=Penicillium mononematosum TaxID=268346 RepID=UPI002548D86E|nr:uncharacterized protein N7519_009198 [Penicillium mononematosum]KAJ6178737.1 hypothetical protein N7519_009198 [Penicillium mononematosum]
MLNADTDSIVFGRTSNPYNREFGVAGSRIGTDGAGGYRLPLDGRRIMGTGVMGTTEFGQLSVTGFLGRSVQDVALFTKLPAEAKPWEKDPFIYPHSWQSLSLPKAQRLRLGVWSSNDFVHLHPPVDRGLKVAQESLRKARVELVEFHGPDICRAWETGGDLSYLRELLSKESHTEIMKATEIITKKAPCPPPTIAYIHSMNARIGAPLYLWERSRRMFAEKDIDRKVQVTPFNAHNADLQDMYDADSFHVLPLAVQLIGRGFEDEKLLAVSEAVHDLIKQTSF